LKLLVFGFGGHCFPKDLDAMIYLMVKNDVDPIILESAREKNNKVRKNLKLYFIHLKITQFYF